MEAIKEEVVLLQQAAKEVESTKRSLKERASDVKRQIRDSISRQLEALRHREVWLLEQVELIQHVKEETLCQQLAELNQAVGALQSTMSMLEDNVDANDLEVLEAQVREKVEDLHKFNLTAEQLDYLAFSGRNFELLEMIHKFGVLDSGSSQLEKQVCTVFQGFHVAESGYGANKQPTFYTPSGANQDWILKEDPSDAAVQVKFKHPHAELSLTEWLCPFQSPPHTQYSSKISQNTFSIDQWLSDSHRGEQPMEDVEEQPTDEVLSLDKWLLKSDGKESQSSELFGYYRAVQQSDAGQWLIVSGGVTSHKLNTALIGETYAKIAASSPEQWLADADVTVSKPLRTSLIGDTYARIAASAIENWLAGKRSAEAGKNLSLENAKEDCSEHCNCLQGECEAGSMEFSETSSNLSDWLSVQKEDGEESTEADFAMKAVDVEDIADWLLKSKSKEKSFQGSSTGAKNYYGNLCSGSMETWLSPASTLPKFDVLSTDETGMKKYAEKLSMDSDQMWLHQSQNDQEPIESSEKIKSGMSEYLEALPDDYNQWLIQQPSDPGICKWLARSSTATCKNCPKMCSKGLFKVFDEVTNHSSQSWLLPATETMQG